MITHKGVHVMPAYDYIIVGTGSAGCVLANRFSEDPQIRVLLVEAGGPDTKAEIHIPAAFSKLFKSSYDWNYQTAAEPEMQGRTLQQIRQYSETLYHPAGTC